MKESAGIKAVKGCPPGRNVIRFLSHRMFLTIDHQVDIVPAVIVPDRHIKPGILYLSGRELKILDIRVLSGLPVPSVNVYLSPYNSFYYCIRGDSISLPSSVSRKDEKQEHQGSSDKCCYQELFSCIQGSSSPEIIPSPFFCN